MSLPGGGAHRPPHLAAGSTVDGGGGLAAPCRGRGVLVAVDESVQVESRAALPPPFESLEHSWGYLCITPTWTRTHRSSSAG